MALEAVARGDISMKMNPSMWLDVMAHAIDEHGARLASRRWNLLCAKDDAPDFICSDIPAILVNRKPELFPEEFLPGIMTPHTWMVMPLNRQVALVGSLDNNHPRGSADAKQVGFINKLIIDHAARFIYSSTNSIIWRRGNKLHGFADLIDSLTFKRSSDTAATSMAKVPAAVCC